LHNNFYLIISRDFQSEKSWHSPGFFVEISTLFNRKYRLLFALRFTIFEKKIIMVQPLQLFSKLIHHFHGEGKVTYILSGSPNDFNLTYTGSNAVTFQEPHATKSWRKTFTVKDGEFVYFSAQSNTDHSKIKVKIMVNGKVFKEAEAEGDYAIATAAGCVACHK
jgi:hypothetical protein